MSAPQEFTPDPEPWQELLTRLCAATTIEGVVVSVTEFGAFVRLHDGPTGGVDGLLHVSVWAGRPDVGSTVAVRVLHLDMAGRRISLTAA